MFLSFADVFFVDINQLLYTNVVRRFTLLHDVYLSFKMALQLGQTHTYRLIRNKNMKRKVRENKTSLQI